MNKRQPEKIHYSGEPLDEDLYQKGRDDELRAMQDHGVYVEIPIREAVGGKHIRGFPMERRQGEMAFCGHRGDHRVTRGQSPGHATTDDRASNDQSCRFVSHFRWSSHENDSFLGCQASVFFFADLNEVIYVHRVQTCARLDIAGGFGRHCMGLA